MRHLLQLHEIVKTYTTGGVSVQALRGVSIAFRESEFVSILGPSGCGKTTLLNVIGGLDRYDSGELTIDGRATRSYKDSDWDSYRNHTIGFVFQSYNLIPHQTVLRNVELALTLSGVSKSERRKRATQALEKVGLGDQLHKKPNQMSGGQMQRVAIARALVNDPKILLADEPTGALDSETSVQIMDLLKEISENRLVIMVTHNPELAQTYSTRIVRLLDGQVTDDTNPYTPEVAETADADKQVLRQQKKLAKKQRRQERTSMSFWTALGLSTNNLLTKKGRTFMTSFAGSIGIIGIALILSLSNGFQLYINSVQQDALSTYPVSIERQTMDISSMLESMAKSGEKSDHTLDRIYSNPIMTDMMQMFSADITTNDLASFKQFIENPENGVADLLSTPPQYGYDLDLNVYKSDVENGVVQLSPSNVLTDLMGNFGMGGSSTDASSGGFASMSSMSPMGAGMRIWTEIIDNPELLNAQYDVVQGKWPQKYDEVVVVTDKNNEITDFSLYALGLLDQDELLNMISTLMNGGEYTPEVKTFTYDEILNTTFSLVLPADYYAKNEDGAWENMQYEDNYMEELVRSGVQLKVVGIVRPNEEATATSITGTIGYTHALTDYMIAESAKREIVRAQLADPDTDVFTGLTFRDVEEKQALAERAKKAKKKAAPAEKSTTAPADVALRGRLHPTVGTLDMTQKPAVGRIDTSPMSEEEIYAYIDEKVPQEQREETREMVELFLKNTRTLSERRKMTQALDKAMAETEIPNVGKISGEQAYSYVLLLNRDQKLALLTAMITGDTSALQAQLPADLLSTTEPASESEQPPAEESAAQSSTAAAEESEPATSAVQTTTAAPEEPETPPAPVVEAAESLSVNKKLLGMADTEDPDRINLYPIDFAAKEKLQAVIEQYNDSMRDADAEEKVIEYTDYMAIFLSSVTTIVNVVSYVLIAFVAISLVVSSIMIGIITYISVLERTKEIGILRSIGASKRDISRVFNAETLIVGLAAGVIGILATLLLNIPVNIVIKALVHISNVSRLPVGGAVALILISILLTVIAGLVPSRYAAKKDPVEALRTE